MRYSKGLELNSSYGTSPNQSYQCLLRIAISSLLSWITLRRLEYTFQKEISEISSRNTYSNCSGYNKSIGDKGTLKSWGSLEMRILSFSMPGQLRDTGQITLLKSAQMMIGYIVSDHTAKFLQEFNGRMGVTQSPQMVFNISALI